MSNETKKHMLYKQFAAWNCNGCSIVSLTHYFHNPIFQKLPDNDKDFENGADERIYIDLRDSYGYISMMEKPSQKNPKMIIKVELKTSVGQKNEPQGLGVYKWQVSLHAVR